jgi:hypothetical protein
MAPEKEAQGGRPQKNDGDGHRDEDERDHVGDRRAVTVVRSYGVMVPPGEWSKLDEPATRPEEDGSPAAPGAR